MNQETFDMIKRLGQAFKPAVLPSDLKRGKIGTCFDTCAILAMNNPQYQYVEGMTSNPLHPDIWILHAWLTDGIHAFDPTWRAIDNANIDRPLPSTYIGIIMPTIDVLRFMRQTEYQGVIANRDRAPEISEKLLMGIRK